MTECRKGRDGVLHPEILTGAGGAHVGYVHGNGADGNKVNCSHGSRIGSMASDDQGSRDVKEATWGDWNAAIISSVIPDSTRMDCNGQYMAIGGGLWRRI